MTDREQMIEKAAKAMAILDDYDGCFERLAGTDPEEPLSTDAEDAEFWLKRARAALAVFEQSSAPTDQDERDPAGRLFRSQAYKALAAERDFSGHMDDGRRTAFYEGWSARERWEHPEPPEADATPDEAFELGRVAGYDEAMREHPEPPKVHHTFATDACVTKECDCAGHPEPPSDDEKWEAWRRGMPGNFWYERATAAESKLARIADLHHPMKVWESDRSYTIVCAECKLQPHPCATVAILNEKEANGS